MESPKVTLRVDNNVTYIDGSISREHYKMLKRELGFLPKDAIWRIRQNEAIAADNPQEAWRKNWDGYISTLCAKGHCRCFLKKRDMHFSSGLLYLARKFFDDHGITYNILDIRTKYPNKDRDFTMSDDYEIRDYIIPVVEKSVKWGRGIIRMATGGGKTPTACHIIANLGRVPVVFYVTSIDLLHQAKSELEKFIRLDGLPVKVGHIGGGEVDIQDITVMTIQSAIRALGAKWQKYDDEDKNEKEGTAIEKNRTAIADLISSARVLVADEIQHWAAETCQIISDASISARYRFGMSATPWRDGGDDILIEACFGKKIADIDASVLIDKGFLIKPEIFFIPMTNMQRLPKSTYPAVYKQAIVQNPLRNQWIMNIATSMAEQGRIILILCKYISHGKLLEKLIPGSVFLHGAVSGKKRKAHLDKMRVKEAGVTIATSLPYSEPLLICNNGIISQIEIGDLCENYSENVKHREIEILASQDGKIMDWSTITDLHIHKKQNGLVKVTTDRYEDVYVTKNHSLVDCHLNQIKPSVGMKASVPYFSSRLNRSHIEHINVLHVLSHIDDTSLEVQILGLTQPMIRQFNTLCKFMKDPQSVSKSTRLKYSKISQKYTVSHIKAIQELVDNFHFYKRKCRATLKDVCDLEYIYDFFDARIFIRRSRKNFSLPIKLPIDENLAILSGLMSAEGHIKHQSCPTCKSRYDFIFTGMEDSHLSREGQHDIDKKNIRNIFKESLKNVFSCVDIIETSKQIRFNGKLMYYLWLSLGHLDRQGRKKIPDYIYNASRRVQESFLWGFYLGDGSKKLDYRENKKNSDIYTAIILCNSSRPFVSGLCFLLKIMNLRYYMYSSPPKGKSKLHRYQVCVIDGFYNLLPTRQQDNLDFTSPERVQNSIDFIDDNSQFVYDISVDGAHNFVAGCGGILCHNSIFDEGIDCRPLDTLILAGSGKSATRALQRVGRTLRLHEGKNDAVIIDFEDHCPYLLKHSHKRRSLYMTEPNFVIKYIKTGDNWL